MVAFALFGAGRIGKIHAGNIAANPGSSLKYVSDAYEPAALELAAEYGAKTVTIEEALKDPEIGAVLVASSTDTHADLIEQSARAGKAILCEKPIDLDLDRTRACLQVADECGVMLALGFNRRHDPNFFALKSAIDAGKIGKVEMVQITSRDPSPPPAEYVARSGGLFRDMMIHDFDMAHWLLGEVPETVYASASCLVDPAIGEAGDIDTAMVTMKTGAGVLCQISNSRRAAYGYDQRIEVFGEKGMLRAENIRPTSVELTTGEGTQTDTVLHFFLERYEAAYKAELQDFLTAISEGRRPLAAGSDGQVALELAEAAISSHQSGKVSVL